MSPNPLRKIPSVNELLESPPLRKLVDRISHNVVVDGARKVLDELRQQAQNAAADITPPAISELAERVARRILEHGPPRLVPVVNATGVLLSAELGPAPLADEALEEMTALGRAYANVGLDLESGQRWCESEAAGGLLCGLTGAEAALVTANATGATMAALAALAAGREVVVSRGQLVDAGGTGRLSDVVVASGAILREVGATNRTTRNDYERAVHEKTAALLLVHPSNYVLAGFSESTGLEQLVEVGRRHKLPVIHDIGSGGLADLGQFGLAAEPIASESIKAGADLVLLRGDRLLGGPSCGILLGRKALVERIANCPTAAACRADKLTLSALGATLQLYGQPEKARQRVPLLSLIGTSAENLKGRAERLAPQMAQGGAVESAEAVAATTYLGDSPVPSQQLATWCIALTPAGRCVDRLALALRTGSPAVVGRIEADRLMLDLRSVPPHHDQDLVDAVIGLAPEAASPSD